MRDLAKIVTIKELLPIEGKDRIELATFNENLYRVIVQKGFKVGDTAIFVEADSLLPNDSKYEFLKARCFKESLQRYLIKPMKMAGHISMGIVFDMSFLPKRKKPYKANEDVTDILDIKKYEPVEDASPKKQKGFVGFMWKHSLTRPIIRAITALIPKENKSFPTWLIPKSDETNLQDCSFVLDKYANVETYVTAKMEGQSATYLFQPKRNIFGRKIEMGTYTVCSRNNAYFVKRGMPHLFDLSERLGIKEKLLAYYKKYGISLAIQGEVCGPKIQKNIYDFPCHWLFVYKIRDLTNARDLPWCDLELAVARLNELGEGKFDILRVVPLVREFQVLEDMDLGNYKNAEFLCHLGFKKPFFNDGNDVIEVVSGKKGKDYFLHEGVVVRGMNNEFSFKIKDAEYAYDFSGKE